MKRVSIHLACADCGDWNVGSTYITISEKYVDGLGYLVLDKCPTCLEKEYASMRGL